jgi:DNA-directed RNA polymerase specialized sigma24 family protein
MTRNVGPILQLIRSVVEDQRVKEPADQELVRLFSTGRDEAAFHGLLRRHGPMVLEVCRNVLGNEAETEDAFQATFLILVQTAGRIRKTASVGSWLHGVAYRTALKARAEFARRQKHENRKSGQTPPAASDDLSWRDVQQVKRAPNHEVSKETFARGYLFSRCRNSGASHDARPRLHQCTNSRLNLSRSW